MRKIGIVDITTVGSAICQLEIVQAAAREDRSGKHPPFSVDSLSFDRYKAAVAARDWSAMAQLILESIGNLKAAGADFIIIPSNTPHYAFDKIASQSPLPLLNLITLVSDECNVKGYKRVAVLGTRATMEGDLYKKPLVERGIMPVIPDDAVRGDIDTLIYKIIAGEQTSSDVDDVATLIKQLECDAYILGCTELPEVYNSNILGKTCVDTTRLLGQKALAHAKQDFQPAQSVAGGAGVGSAKMTQGK